MNLTAIIVAGLNALALVAVALIGMVSTNRIRGDVADVHHEVTTANGQTLAALSDAAETRRIGLVPLADRSATESQHFGQIPPV